jgi:predicted nucleotidyltransferase
MSSRDKVSDLLATVRRWAEDRADLRAVAVVGSWARGGARPDSDVDVLLLTNNADAYLADLSWLPPVGPASLIRTRRWGVVVERRVVLDDGLEFEFGVTLPEWASTEPLDEGTRRVASNGLVALYDPEGLLGRLVDAVAREAVRKTPADDLERNEDQGESGGLAEILEVTIAATESQPGSTPSRSICLTGPRNESLLRGSVRHPTSALGWLPRVEIGRVSQPD